MDIRTQALIRETLTASTEGRIHFGQVLAQLVCAQVESYAVDYRGKRVSYYLLNDESLTVELETADSPIGAAFDPHALRAAIQGAQQGEVMYPEFVRRSMAAGCIGYTVWIAGRHVTYYGRQGETHVERFPN